MRALGLLALAACGGGTADPTIDAAHDPCAPLALVATDATPAQQASLQDAQALWRDHGAPSLGLRAGATLEVRFDDAAPVFHGRYDNASDLIYINRTLTDESTLSIVIAHELGHAFGLAHIADRESVMNAGNLTIAPNDLDRSALAAIWGSCD